MGILTGAFYKYMYQLEKNISDFCPNMAKNVFFGTIIIPCYSPVPKTLVFLHIYSGELVDKLTEGV